MSTHALDSSVTLDEVFVVVGAKRVPLAPELAGYLALEIAEHADPNGGDVDPKSVFVGEEGTVALVKPRRDTAAGDAETSVRAALARLLDMSGSQTPALTAACKRRSGSGLDALAEELEAALIPVNRAAARRALARLAREVRRVTMGVGRNAVHSGSEAAPPSRRSAPLPQPPPSRESTPQPPHASAAESFEREEEPTTARGMVPEDVLRKATSDRAAAPRARPLSPPAFAGAPTAPPEVSELPTAEFESDARSPSQTDVDSLIAAFGVSGAGEHRHARDLKAMAGLDPTPPPPQAPARREAAPDDPGHAGGGDSDVEGLLALGSSQPALASTAAPPAPPARPRELGERQLPTQPSQIRRRASLPSTPQQPRGGGKILVVLGLLAVAGGAYAVLQLRPGARAVPAPERPSPSAKEPASAPSACKGTLVITDVPAHAEVLLRQGQAPVDVERMPVGTRLEFVSTAEGYAPKRVVVPAGATWDTGPDGKPRFEAAVQLDKSKARAGTNDPWPAGEPGSTVGGKGPPGTVRVVATPRGAEIWMLAGIGPEARVEQVSCDEDVDVLLAGPTTYRKRLHVAASDFVAEGSAPAAGRVGPLHVARVTAK
jgi:hypothetical protein